jgi:hypothetical protein
MKTICVPKDSEAQAHLNLDESQPGELIELIIDDDTISKLWEVGFFDSINRLAHSNIDKFEDESIIEKEQLMKVINSNLFDQDLYDVHLYSFIGNIGDLFKKAIRYNTGVYFYF